MSRFRLLSDAEWSLLEELLPRPTGRRTERRIVALRFTRRWGPHRIAYHLRLHRSTVGRVLARYRMALLVDVDQSTGLPVRKPGVVRTGGLRGPNRPSCWPRSIRAAILGPRLSCQLEELPRTCRSEP